jgi:hypothetical protein
MCKLLNRSAHVRSFMAPVTLGFVSTAALGYSTN